MFPTKRVSGIVKLLHTAKRNRPKLNKRVPNGCLFAPLQNGRQITHSHPLDDEAEYRRFLREDLLAECEYFVRDLPLYRNNMVRMLKYTVPAFHPCWTYGPELVYRFVAPKEIQTRENLTKCRILRCCVELKFACSAVIDDIADASDMRQGKPSWRMEGASTAVFDGMFLDTLPYFLLKKHFKKAKGYVRMHETLSRASMDLIIGESLDTISQKNIDALSGKTYSDIVRYKAGRFVSMQAALGMLHAGILDEELLQKAENIFCDTGELIQIWDDFCDYYCSSSQTGKPSCDLKNAGTTWASSVALEYFSEAEKITFNECYGSEDPDKMETVRLLYDKIDLPNIYVEFMQNRRMLCKRKIEDLQHVGLQEACNSWLHWLLGDV
ncbi:hypothetical protein GE061_018076 [Apolygus lucorum]|uniref:Farnesyl pyrophosphate synthase n=1 Tax=Apolygus lucorum TaxID=248454 RepID=A0A8S9XCP4_APOLU|nr:hypothetical protein GE061_018076 [Apolygus lucorum]